MIHHSDKDCHYKPHLPQLQEEYVNFGSGPVVEWLNLGLYHILWTDECVTTSF